MHADVVRVAVVQASPVFLDLPASVEKACGLIREAAAGGARFVAFPEGFLPGHPLWYHFHAATSPVSRDLATRLILNSVVVPGPETAALAAAAADAGVYVMMGMCTRASEESATLYNSQVLFDPHGRILNVHDKLTPTVGERLVHAPGDAHGLRAVATDIGRISGLICGENSNPLALFSLIAEGTQIHVSSWPSLPGRAMLSRCDRALVAGRAVAFMTKAYVLNAVGVVDESTRRLLVASEGDEAFVSDPSLTGGSSIIGPDGNVVAGPANHEEQLLFGDLDLSRCWHEKHVHDLAGHYNRRDVFTLTVDRTRRRLFEPHDDGTPVEISAADPAGDVC